LREIGAESKIPAYLIADKTELGLKMLLGVPIGLTPVHRRRQFSSRM
jgi:hypothetical protein